MTIAGDGTTTATILSEAIYTEGLKCLVAGSNPVGIKRGIEKAVEAVTNELVKMSISVSGKKEIEQVGTIAANNDPEIGKQISDAMEQAGRDGVIAVEEGKGLDTTVELVEGMQFEKGYLSHILLQIRRSCRLFMMTRIFLSMRRKYLLSRTSCL